MNIEKQQQALEALANIRLSDDCPRDWTATDLTNAGFILLSIAASLGAKHLKDFSIEQRLMLSAEFVKNIRQSIHLFTGIDPADAVTDFVLDAEEIG